MIKQTELSAISFGISRSDHSAAKLLRNALTQVPISLLMYHIKYSSVFVGITNGPKFILQCTKLF